MAPRVLIIGGGIGGLCLAQGLRKRNVPFHVYEKDSDSITRTQGYRIRVAREAVEALKYCLDQEIWRLFELTCAETKLGPIPEVDAITAAEDIVQIANGSGPPTPGSGPKPYTVDRTMLRETLLRGLGKHITWGKEFKCFDVTEDSVQVTFADGTVAEGNLLVGADGATSLVRAQYLPHHRPQDTGGRMIYGKTVLTPKVEEALAPALRTCMSAIKDRTREEFLTMILEPVRFRNQQAMKQEGFRCPRDYMYWVLGGQPEAMGVPEGDASHLSPEESAKLALHVTKDWHPSTRVLIQHQAEGQTNTLSIKSFGAELPQWRPSAHVTLIGDAVHTMSPAAGSGAITALRDAQHLCEVIVSCESSGMENAIGDYESQMRVYAGETIHKSLLGSQKIFNQRPWQQRNVGEVMTTMHKKKD